MDRRTSRHRLSAGVNLGIAVAAVLATGGSDRFVDLVAFAALVIFLGATVLRRPQKQS
jgi:hypothetical protein